MQHEPPQIPINAEISYGVAIIPTNPLKDKVAAASLRVTRSFENENVIDNKRFPAHVSLYLGGTSRDYIPMLSDAIDKAIRPHLLAKLRADSLYSDGGFIGVDVAVDSATRLLFDAVVSACAQVHQTSQLVRPHLISRWSRLTSAQRDLILRMGTYKVDPSGLHISVAQVDPQDLNSAFVLARRDLTLPEEFGIESVQIVDVGHNNEKWVVLWSSANS